MEQIGQTPASCGVGSPFCPRLAPAPGKNTHHHFQIGGQEPLRVRHLHQDFTCREREREMGDGGKTPRPFPGAPGEAEQQRATAADGRV